MRARLLWIVGIGIALFPLITLGGETQPPTHAQRSGQPLVRGWDRDIKKTTVAPHLEQEIVPGENLVWCSTFQLAWDELCDLTGGPIKMENAPAMVPILNRKRAAKRDLDQASYVAMAGFAEDGIYHRIRQELTRKFHGQADPALLNSLPKQAWVAYAYLFKDLPFRWAFRRFPRALSFAGKSVDCFGVFSYPEGMDPGEKRKASQVTVWDYRSNDDLIVELKTKAKEDRLILAKVAPRESLARTIKMVGQRIAAGKPSLLRSEEDFLVPILDFELFRDYHELAGHPLKTANGKLDQLGMAALQSIRFRLYERGAVLKSEGWAAGGAGPPKTFVFNKPFLILLKRRQAKNPYFAMWVGNADLLIATPKAGKDKKH